MSIYKKLFEIQKATRGFGKDTKGNNYEFVSGTKVLNHIRYKMDELGVILKQEVLSIENVRQDYKTGIGTNYEKPKSEINSKVMMRFTWVDVDTGDKDENLFGANGQNDWDKGVGSALTYAERYFLLKYFHIPTDEDDIDSLPPKDEELPNKPEEKKKEDPKKSENNQKPWLTEEQFNGYLSLINKGEKWLEKVDKAYRMKTAYRTTLETAENNYKPKV